MKVLVTGPGRLGASLLPQLAAQGITGRVLRRSRQGDLPPGWDAVQADVTAGAPTAACAGCDVVLHMAALTHSNRRRQYAAVNVGGTANVLAAAEAAGVRHFVHVSTRAITPEGGDYSISKATAEDLVRRADIPWTILRPAEVYGIGGREGVSSYIDRIRRGRWVPIVGDGSALLAPVLVDDVLAGFASALRRPGEGATFHLAGPEEISLLDLTRRLAAYFRTAPRRVFLPPAGLRTAARAMRLLGLRHPPLVVDQVARLLSRKPYEIATAAASLGFRPRCLEDGLDALSRREKPDGDA